MNPPVDRRRLAIGVLSLICFAAAGSTRAQVVEQTITLQAGWNAIFPEVQPEPAEWSAVLGGLPVRSVWLRDPQEAGELRRACTTDSEGGACAAATQTGWRVWFPPGHPAAAVNSLQSLQVGRAYLVEMSASATLTLRGLPNARRIAWRSGYNLTGFHVVEEAEAAPTFQAYLSASAAHQNLSVHVLNADGTLSAVADPARQRIRAGAAYWVEADRNLMYDGPIQIDERTLRGIELTGGLTKHPVELVNLRSSGQRVLLAGDGSGAQDRRQTAPPLVWQAPAESGAELWRDLVEVPMDLAPRGETGSRQVLRLGVRKDEARDGDAADDSSESSGLLTVTDEAGFQRHVVVRVRGNSQSGLWVGDVRADKVASLTEGDPAPTPTAAPFTFRIIIHKSPSQYVLLREVVLVYQQETQSYSLVTPACFDLLDETEISPRVSTAAFSFDDAVALNGGFDGQLRPQTPIAINPDHTLNPYRHPFNPLHEEGFEITRDFTLTFDADGGGDPDYGITWLAGRYEERVTGLHRNEIRVEGRFDLRRISTIEELCAP